LLLLLAVFAAVWFGTLEYRKLIKPDEGRYAEIPREMVVTGDWTTPRLNGIKYFEKPVLQCIGPPPRPSPCSASMTGQRACGRH
jgi:4-amino-4-deoxy-L-arabinose transferase-like glycosyltransferase